MFTKRAFQCSDKRGAWSVMNPLPLNSVCYGGVLSFLESKTAEMQSVNQGASEGITSSNILEG